MAIKPKPIKYVYKAIKYSDESTEYKQLNNSKSPLLSDTIKLTEIGGFTYDDKEYCCEERKGHNWRKNGLTALFRTSKENVFLCGRDNEKDLIVIALYDNNTILHAFYYQDYSTRNIQPLITNL
jgi:hypothetical protein